MKLSELSAGITAKTALLVGVAVCATYVLAVWLVGPYLPAVDFAPDAGFSYYYWQLPNPDWLTRATAWGGYLAHQLVVWGLIFYAQRRGLKYTKALHPVNVLALAANLVFVVLHWLVSSHVRLASYSPLWLIVHSISYSRMTS